MAGEIGRMRDERNKVLKVCKLLVGLPFLLCVWSFEDC